MCWRCCWPTSNQGLKANMLAERLKQARSKASLSVAELAKLTKMTPQAIYAIENGRIKSTVKIVSIAKALGINANWLENGEIEGNFPGIALSADEEAMLKNFRLLNKSDRDTVLRISDALKSITLKSTE
jgi:transcriptional regulator with XRE-family HTH domain